MSLVRESDRTSLGKTHVGIAVLLLAEILTLIRSRDKRNWEVALLILLGYESNRVVQDAVTSCSGSLLASIHTALLRSGFLRFELFSSWCFDTCMTHVILVKVVKIPTLRVVEVLLR